MQILEIIVLIALVLTLVLVIFVLTVVLAVFVLSLVLIVVVLAVVLIVILIFQFCHLHKQIICSESFYYSKLKFYNIFLFYTINLHTFATIKQISNPIIVGIKKDNAVHFQLPVSFFIVQHVVPHGKCISENSIVHIAVTQVQPLATSKLYKSERESNSFMLPVHI